MTTITSTLPGTPSRSLTSIKGESFRKLAIPMISGLALAGALSATAASMCAAGRLSDLERSERSVIAQLSALNESVSSVEGEIRLSLADAAARVSDSVVMVGFIDEASGNFQPFGTAWVIAEREGEPVLATNAHVARSVDEFASAGQRIRVRSVIQGGLVEWDVVSARSHDGANEFAYLGERPIMRRVGDDLRRVNPVGVADVALLTLETGAKLGSPIPLASPEQLRALRQGTEVAGVGFPTENMLGPRDRNPATLAMGHLLAATNFAFELGDADQRYLLHHDVRMHGGSSGSPLLMLDPRTGDVIVIGLHCAGDVVFTEGGRVPVGGAYAQRIDLAAEMLDDDRTIDEARIDQWQREIDSMSMSLDERLEFLALVAERYLESEGIATSKTRSRILRREQIEITGSRGEASSVTVRLRVEEGQLYSIAATAENWADLDLEVYLGGARLAYNTLEDGLPWNVIRAPRDGEIEIVVTVARSYAETTEARLQFARFEGGV